MASSRPSISPGPLRLDCPAKVNLALSIGAPLPNGYHPLASWMAAVRFGDQLSLDKSTDGAGRFDIAFDPAAPVPARVDWPLEKDLACRAHRLMEAQAGTPLPVSLTLRKLIPPGAGLGGGSSNAAATLVGIDRLFNMNLGRDKLAALGQKLGSDVGFLVGAIAGGDASAIVTGLGETTEPAPLAAPIHLVLIFPPFGCPTGEVYAAFDRLGNSSAATGTAPETARVRELTRRSPLPPDGPFNDLAEPACIVRPQLKKILEELRGRLRMAVHVTGSGSTLFVVASGELPALALARQVTALTRLPAVATRTV